MRKQLCALSLAVAGSAAFFVPSVAHAEDDPKPYPECTKAPTDSETAAAKGAYQAGNASFDEADYPRAITYWEDAYRRDCTANLLLKNLARAYELYGQKRQAVVALETYLVREPASNDKDQIQRRIEVLKKQIASEKAAPPPAGVQTPATTTPPPPPPPSSTEPAPVDTHSGKRSFVPLIVAGGGLVVAVVGLAVYSGASKDVNHYEDLCPNRACPPGPDQQANIDGGQKARSKKITGGVVTGVGAAALAGGLIWYFAQPRSSSGVATASAGSLTKPRVDPALSPGFAGVALSGAF
jgi:hypothetical protein